MNQRIKPVIQKDSPDYPKYITEITLLHQMLVQAMKCKQTTDITHVKNLHKLLDKFEKSYFKDKFAKNLNEVVTLMQLKEILWSMKWTRKKRKRCRWK